jgi:hypothetical protein
LTVDQFAAFEEAIWLQRHQNKQGKMMKGMPIRR